MCTLGCSVIVGIPERRAAEGLCAALPTTPSLCDDFEGPLGGRWDKTIGALTLVNDPVANGHALLATANSSDAAFLERTFTATPSSLTLSFDVRAEVLPTTDVTFIAQIAFGTGCLALYAVPGKLIVQEMVFRTKADTVDHTPTRAIDLSRPVRLTLEASFQPPRVRLLIDNAEVLNEPLATDFPASAPTLRLGPSFINTVADRRLRYDNVVFDTR